ncbi:MAG: diguanylate cyclase [Gammaproteobacteria bacterium]
MRVLIDKTTSAIKTSRFLRLTLFCLAVISTLCLLEPAAWAKAPQSQLEPVSLQLSWSHQFQFAGYYAALEQGYYRALGLDVEIRDGGYDDSGQAPHPVEEVLFGRADFGTTRADLLLYHGQGLPVVVIANIMQHSPFIFLSTDDFNIKRLEDITDQPVSLTLSDSGKAKRIDAETVTTLKIAGLNPESLNNHEPSWKLEDLLAGKTQLIPAYITDEPYMVEKSGKQPVIIRPIDYGIDFYGDLLFTRHELIVKRPDLVEKFRQASLRGWQYAMTHQNEIVRLIVDKYKTRRPGYDENFLKNEARIMEALLSTDVVEIGYINRDRWQRIAEVYQGLGLMSEFDLDRFLFQPEKLKNGLRIRRWVQMGGLVFLLAGAIIVYLIHINYRLRREVRKRKAVEKKLRELAETDGLTQIANRHKFNMDIAAEFYRARRYHLPLSLLIFDIDLFKRINDQYGHVAGDEVLKSIAQVTQGLLRNSDQFFRFGGEEFVIILPNTEAHYAGLLAERVRSVNSTNVVSFGAFRISYTISIGLAQLAETDKDSEALFRRADDALYTAKNSGRNCVKTG